jgi:hypothetical protein
VYRCKVCNRVGEPGMVRLCHRITRADGSILQELPVCQECHRRLKSTTLADLLREHVQEPAVARKPAVAAVTPIPLKLVTVT